MSDWKETCAKCMDGEIEPRHCEYYGEPNGCNSPSYGQHPTTEKSSAVGNAAAMREALVAVKKSIDGIGESSLDCDPTILMASLTQVCARLSARIERALSAPARNCDLYASATEALKAQDVAFNEDNFKNGECKLGCPGCDDGLINCKILWLFATAKERKGEGDEQK